MKFYEQQRSNLLDVLHYHKDIDRLMVFDDVKMKPMVEMRKVDRAKVHREKYFHLDN